MPRITQGRIGLALWGGLIVALISIAALSWVQLGSIGQDISGDYYLDDARALAYIVGSLNEQDGSGASNPTTDALQRYANATGAYVSLHDADGAIIFASGESGNPAREAGAQEVLAALGPDGSGTAQRLNPLNGVESAWFAHALPDRSGLIRIAVPLDSVGVVVEPYRRLLLYTSIAAGIVILLLLLVVTQRTAAPLKNLARTLRAGRSPNAEDYATANPEVRDIARLIGRMTQEERGITSAVETQQTRLVSILDNLNVGIIVLAEDERVLLANAAASQLFGFAQHVDEETTLIGLVRDFEAAEVARRALSEFATAVGEITHAGEPGRTTRLVAAPYREGEERRVLLAAYDVSEERRAQRLRHEFLANASHEIRTPLAGIQATLETLDLGAIDDPDAARPFVSNALVEVQRLTTFVESLLDLSRLEMGWTRLSLQTIAVVDVIDRCLGMMSSMASRAGIEVVVDVQQGLPEISADAGRLHQVMVNLVHNAIKFTPAGGRVTISSESSNGSVWLHIKDTGIGIPPEDVSLLMDRVGQGDESGMRGGGLGLAIVRQIVEAHQGEVRVESEIGKGSTFSLRLPLHVQQP